ncbi:hypothetical protein QJQ45_011993 [Haematococcus lacustris]|nr:hypothetical protein QJQ45_011993 [Haematococcus lacustris]
MGTGQKPRSPAAATVVSVATKQSVEMARPPQVLPAKPPPGLLFTLPQPKKPSPTQSTLAPRPLAPKLVIAPKPVKLIVPGQPKTLQRMFSDRDIRVEALADVTVQVRTASGRPPPPPLVTLNQLAKGPYRVRPTLLRALVQQRINVATPVQRYAFPTILRGHDLLASSSTGSGKTLAYLVPVLTRLMRPHRSGGPRNTAYPVAIVLVPTRELAVQVWEEANRLMKGSQLKAVALYGGQSTVDEVRALRDGVDLVVATPSRLLHWVESKRKVKLERLALLVVDEADRMLDMGFEPLLIRLPPEVLALAAKYLRPNAVFVHVGDWQGASPLVKQRLELVSGDEVRKHLLIQRLQQLQGMAVVFTNSMAAAAEVHTLLTQQPGLSVSLLHSGLEQQQREEALQCFRYGVTRVLVATGLAGRGLDMPDVTLVINYDMPISLPDYVYRIGRTGRGGRTGESLTFFRPTDSRLAQPLMELMVSVGQSPPDWLRIMCGPQAKSLEAVPAAQARARIATPSHPASGAKASAASWSMQGLRAVSSNAGEGSVAAAAAAVTKAAAAAVAKAAAAAAAAAAPPAPASQPGDRAGEARRCAALWPSPSPGVPQTASRAAAAGMLAPGQRSHFLPDSQPSQPARVFLSPPPWVQPVMTVRRLVAAAPDQLQHTGSGRNAAAGAQPRALPDPVYSAGHGQGLGGVAPQQLDAGFDARRRKEQGLGYGDGAVRPHGLGLAEAEAAAVAVQRDATVRPAWQEDADDWALLQQWWAMLEQSVSPRSATKLQRAEPELAAYSS